VFARAARSAAGLNVVAHYSEVFESVHVEHCIVLVPLQEDPKLTVVSNGV
jgi:hypothetical protein